MKLTFWILGLAIAGAGAWLLVARYEAIHQESPPSMTSTVPAPSPTNDLADRINQGIGSVRNLSPVALPSSGAGSARH